MTLKDSLNDWVEPDDACYYLACSLGIMEYHEGYGEYNRKVKSVFAVDNKMASTLYKILEQMVEVGLLEKRDGWDYRWNASFKGFWEGGNDGRY